MHSFFKGKIFCGSQSNFWCDQSLYDRIGRSSADTVRGYVAMMVFDGFFNSSKMGVMTLSDEEMDAMQMHVLREAYAARPDMLEVIEAVIGSGERM